MASQYCTRWRRLVLLLLPVGMLKFNHLVPITQWPVLQTRTHSVPYLVVVQSHKLMYINRVSVLNRDVTKVVKLSNHSIIHVSNNIVYISPSVLNFLPMMCSKVTPPEVPLIWRSTIKNKINKETKIVCLNVGSIFALLR